MSEWKKVKLGEICERVTSGGTPKANVSSYYNPPTIPWLKTKEVNYCRITETENYISEEGLKNSSAKLISPNSVIIAMYGQGDTAGRIAINKIPLATNQACCNLTIDKSKADYEFIYYQLCTLYDKLVSLKAGAAQPNLNARIIKNLEIIMPSLPIQHRIATILSRYDSLIENYQKQIKLLEEAAQRLYKEWFVDLRFPGHENTNIIDGVPEGWEKKTIADVCTNISSGSTPSRSNKAYWENGTIKWVKTKELQDGWILDTEEYISQEGYNSSSTKMFPANTILMAIYASPTLGRLGILSTDCCCNQAALGLIADENIISWQWLFWKLYELRDEFNAIARGAGQQNISGIVVKNKEIIIPDKGVIDGFTSVVSKMFEQQKSLSSQLRLLTEARDRLLPKLMSGEIEI